MNNTALIEEFAEVYADAEDLINIGAYARGSSPKIDQSIQMQDAINRYLRQGIFEHSGFDDAKEKLLALFSGGTRFASAAGAAGRARARRTG